MTRVLAAGDHFVLTELLVEALAREVPDGLEISELTLGWPTEPFGRVAEVDEASGSEDQMIEALRGVEVCVTQMAPLTEKVLDASPDLRLFCISRGGPVNANIAAATEHGVAVTYAPGRNATATAEQSVGMLIATTRRIPQTHADLSGGTWRGDYYRYDAVGPELENSTVGVIGYGAIGSRVARILAGFGANVLAHDPYLAPEAFAAGVEQVELDELLSRSRFVTLHARVTPDNKKMIGAAADRPDAARVGARELCTRRAAGLRRGVRRAGLRPPVRCRLRRVRRGADPGRVAATDHARTSS